MERDSFVFYRSFLECIDNLPEESQLECYRAIAKYALDGEAPAEGMAAAILALAKPIIDNNNKRYENGKKGGRKPNNNQTKTKAEPNRNQTETEPEPYVNVYVNEHVNVNENASVNESLTGHKKTYADDPELDQAIKDFIDHRKKLKKPMTDHAIDLLVNKLNKITLDTREQISLINTAIEHGWQTVYEPKGETRAGPPDKKAWMDAWVKGGA